MNLSDAEKKALLQTARTSIMSRFKNENAVFPSPSPQLMKECGAFVTLHKKGRLRGCIGYISAYKPLIDTVKEVAQSSAFSDPRFPSVTEDEVDDLEIEISVLTPFRTISNIDEIEVGTHGIMLKNRFSSGLLLPQVATENNWDLNTFLTHTCLKAGMSGDCWKKPDTSIEIFSAIIFNEKEFEMD